MKHPGFGFGLLTMILMGLLWWFFLPTKTESVQSVTADTHSQSFVTQDPVHTSSKTKRLKTPVVVPRFEPLPRAKAEISHSEAIAEAGVSAPQADYPDKPPVPDYEMPEGPEIMPFVYQRLLFKNAPDDGRIGLALYATVSDPARRKHAYLQRTYLTQLTSFLASHYDFDSVKTEGGKAKFIDMLKERFARRLKGNVLKDLNYAFFETED